ncbi:MAG: Ig-like domain-containing protein, partial [Granulosicoccaceae bacterium]
NCQMETMLSGRVINRGTLDTFTNTGPAPKNIERIDFIHVDGTLTSLSDEGLDLGGHIVAEKRGNNPVQIAAITSLDSNGEPSAYGPLVRISAAGCSTPEICYGVTAVRHQYSFLQSASIAPQAYATRLSGDTENMAVAFVSSRDLGLSTNQRYFGFSLFGRDVDAQAHDLLDPATFPRDTADDFIVLGDGADLYGGMTSLYWDDEGGLAALTGDAFIDQNKNGIFDQGDVGLGGIEITLYEDTDGDRSFDPAIDQPVMIAVTDSNGRFVFPGLPDGHYFAELDESSAAIPAGMTVAPGVNPASFDVLNGEVDPISFAFISLTNDSVVEALGDSVSLHQNTETTIDVLANDSDPVGGGLTLSAVSAASNGSAVIKDNQVVYTPNPGFVGTDSFSYTVTDADGNESTATVAVTVTRFSDINHNGINDYDECGCDDLRLLTGIHGSGVGGGGNALWLLALIPALRGRHFSASQPGASA